MGARCDFNGHESTVRVSGYTEGKDRRAVWETGCLLRAGRSDRLHTRALSLFFSEPFDCAGYTRAGRQGKCQVECRRRSRVQAKFVFLQLGRAVFAWVCLPSTAVEGKPVLLTAGTCIANYHALGALSRS